MNLLSLLLGSMTEENSVGTIAGKTGLTSKQITKLLLIAIPILMKAMTNNASSQSGAASLLSALGQHSSKKSVADQMKEADEEDGAKIIGHILGKDSPAMNEMEKEGIICGYLTLVDWDKTDEQTVTALIEVRCTPQRGQGFDVVAERIYKFAEVNSVYLISGGFDLLITIEGRTLKEISRFVTEKLSAQEAVLSCAKHFILRRYKDHGTILAKKYEDERQLITP